MPRFVTSPALVLRVRDQGESDVILTLLSPKHGRITCIAKGAKRSRRRFVNKLEPYTLLDATWATSRSTLHRLDRAELVDAHPGLRTNPRGFAAAGVLAEQLLFWSREGNPDPETFELARWAFGFLQTPDRRILPVALLRLLALQGYRPHLGHCLDCGRIDRQDSFFAPHRHGIVCSECQSAPVGPATIHLCRGTVNFLTHVLAVPLGRLHRLHATRPCLDEALELAIGYAAFLLQRDLPAWAVYRSISEANKD